MEWTRVRGLGKYLSEGIECFLKTRFIKHREHTTPNRREREFRHFSQWLFRVACSRLQWSELSVACPSGHDVGNAFLTP